MPFTTKKIPLFQSLQKQNPNTPGRPNKDPSFFQSRQGEGGREKGVASMVRWRSEQHSEGGVFGVRWRSEQHYERGREDGLVRWRDGR